jgi:hypothetical protein
LFSFFLPLTVKLTFASTDPTLFVARAIYGWESCDVVSLIINVDCPLSSFIICIRASGFTSVPSGLCHVIVGFGIAENFTFNFAVSVNKHVTSEGLPSTLGLTKNDYIYITKREGS